MVCCVTLNSTVRPLARRFTSPREGRYTLYLGHEVRARDGHLLRDVVAGEADDLHAVFERPRDGALVVRRAHEQHIGEISRYVQVVVHKAPAGIAS